MRLKQKAAAGLGGAAELDPPESRFKDPQLD